MRDIFQIEGRIDKGVHYFHVSYMFFIEQTYDKIFFDLNISPEKNSTGDPELYEEIRESLRTEIGLTEEITTQELIKNYFPLANFISIALKDPNGFRGEDHKSASSRTVLLAKEGSTDCFSNSENPIGSYEVILHVYCIITDKCTYALKVYGE